MQIIRNESKRGAAPNFKELYALIDQSNNVITEGTCLEVLFYLLRMREGMTYLERVQVNLIILDAYGFYPDLLGSKEAATLAATTAASVAASGIIALTGMPAT